MRPRDVLAENFKKLMAATPGRSTFPQIIKAGGGTNGNLDRIRRALTATSVDNLEPLAAVYGLEAWHLLMPTLEAYEGTDDRPVVGGVPQWPFTRDLLVVVLRLTPAEKTRLENVMRAYVDLPKLVLRTDTDETDEQPVTSETDPAVSKGLAIVRSGIVAPSTPALDREDARQKKREQGNASQTNRPGPKRPNSGNSD